MLAFLRCTRPPCDRGCRGPRPVIDDAKGIRDCEDGKGSRDAGSNDIKRNCNHTRTVVVDGDGETDVQFVQLVQRHAKNFSAWEQFISSVLVFLLVFCGGLMAMLFWANKHSAATLEQDWLKAKQEVAAPTASRGENCTYSTPAQAQAWPPHKKQWCCQHQNRGCHAAVTTTTTAALTTSGCEKQCTVNGTMASCKLRLLFAAQFLFAGKDEPCDAASAWVLSKCPSCSECQSSSSGCKKVELLTASAATATAKHACDTRCVGHDGSISCKDRVRATANFTFAGDPDACVRAFASVLEHCPVCTACPLADVSCSTAILAKHSSRY